MGQYQTRRLEECRERFGNALGRRSLRVDINELAGGVDDQIARNCAQLQFFDERGVKIEDPIGIRHCPGFLSQRVQPRIPVRIGRQEKESDIFIGELLLQGR